MAVLEDKSLLPETLAALKPFREIGKNTARPVLVLYSHSRIPMLGAALAGLAGYAYFSRPSKSVQQKAKDEAADMAKRGATGVSGRRGDSGPFRSE